MILNRDDLVVFTVHHQGRDIDLLEIFGEVGLGERFDTFAGVLLGDKTRKSPYQTPRSVELTLHRGYERLRVLEEGWSAALATTCDQS